MTHYVPKIFGHIVPRFGNNSGTYIYPQTRAIVAAMVVKPSGARIIQINNLVEALIFSGVWPKLGVLYVFAAHTAQAALINWINPSGTAALATNSPTFVVDRGFSGDAVSAYIDTQIPWNTVPGMSLNDAHFGVYARGLAATSNLAGLVASAGVSIVRAASQLQTALNTGATSTTADAWATAAGTHVVLSRNSAPNYERYIEGVAQTTAAVASTILQATNISGLRRGGSYANTNGSLCALHAGSFLTPIDVTNTRNALQDLAVSVGFS